jgi:hypothetical protein
MAVAEDRVVHEAEVARLRVQCRWRVLRVLTRRLPAIGSAAAEAAIDQAWMEIYEWESRYAPGSVQRHWERLAYLRAQNGIRERRQHPLIDVDELGEAGALSDGGGGGGIAPLEAARTDARVREIVCQVGGDGRRWLEATLDDPGVPPRVLAQRLGWAPEKLKTVARRTRGHLREFVSARASGAICERRQAVMGAFAATHLARRDPAYAARLGERPRLGPERYEQVALHIAGCEECERAWHKAQNKLLGPRLVFFPAAFAGKLGVAGGSVIAVGRRALGRLDRVLWDLRVRVGSGAGRVTAGGAAGTAGTAGALAGKGAAVCVGVLCATGMGTAALVGLPAGIIASRTVSHHHRDRLVVRHSDSAATATVSTLAVSQAATAQSDTSSARADKSGQRTGTRTVGRPAYPVTPGSLVATSSAANTSTVASQPSARAASTSATATASRSEVSTEYVKPAASSSSQPSSSNSAKHGPCVPGSLSC